MMKVDEIVALGKEGKVSSVDTLLEYTNDEDLVVRAAAIKAIGVIANKHADFVWPSGKFVDNLLGYWKDGKDLPKSLENIRIAAMYTLGRLECPEAVPTVWTAMSDEDKVRVQALCSLRYILSLSSFNYHIVTRQHGDIVDKIIRKAICDNVSAVRKEGILLIKETLDNKFVPLMVKFIQENVFSAAYTAYVDEKAVTKFKTDYAAETLLVLLFGKDALKFDPVLLEQIKNDNVMVTLPEVVQKRVIALIDRTIAARNAVLAKLLEQGKNEQ